VTSSSLPLFDDGPGKDFSVSEVLAQRKPADKAQQRFRKLVANIERKREELRQWQAYEQRYNQRVTSEFEPVRSELLQQQRQMAVLIDELLSQRGQSRRLSRLERAKLRDMLMTLLDADTLAGVELAHRIRKRQFSFGLGRQRRASSLKQLWSLALA
jgi:hypothetical protein